MAYDVDRRPGAFAKAREHTHMRIAFVFLILVLASLLLATLLVLTGSFGLVSAGALVAVAFGVRTFFDVRLDQGIRWGKGANAEIAVGCELATLRADGYIVMHDLDRVVPGNIDHLVSGPTGVFLVETKFKRYVDADLPKVKEAAAIVSRRLEIDWVQPVICFGARKYGPKRVRGVAVMGRDEVTGYIRAQRNPVVPFDRLARFADEQ